MKIIHSKQIWNGFFTYRDGHDAEDLHLEVPFTMELLFTEDSFTGISSDAEAEEIFDRPATVKGFIEEDRISFVLNYPCHYYKDENDKIVLDRNLKHPEIHYLGYFEDDRKSISGTWEMTVYEEKYFDDYLEEIVNGTFEMRRIT